MMELVANSSKPGASLEAKYAASHRPRPPCAPPSSHRRVRGYDRSVCAVCRVFMRLPKLPAPPLFEDNRPQLRPTQIQVRVGRAFASASTGTVQRRAGFCLRVQTGSGASCRAAHRLYCRNVALRCTASA
jgi:hypothetical protein